MQPTAWKASDGTLWFATDGGIASVDPARITPNPIPPQVHIVQIRVDRSTMSRVESGLTLDLGSTHDEVEIVYSAPTFIDPARVAFRYKLEGLNTDWVEAGTRRAAFFSKIPAGEYMFIVQAGNQDGLWNESSTSLALIVRPPFWMTWWFRSIVLVVFLSVGPAIYFRRVTELKRRHAQQQEFSMRLIASQEAERKRIAAELHDSLGQNIIIIKNRALLGKQSGDDMNSVSGQLDEIAKAASATLDDIRKIAYNLRPLNLERFGLTDTIVQTVNDVGKATGIALEVKIENIDKFLRPEVEIQFFRIIQEALNNIVKHAQATSGSVSVSVMDGSIRLVISDNGRGFELTAQSRPGGFGLDGIAQRVNIIGGEFGIDSSVGHGTRVTVTVPVDRSPPKP
jgi:signal transduction histidine kinase